MAKSNGGIIGALNPTSFGKCTVTSQTSSGTLTTQPGTRIVQALVVAGGAGGGANIGGGGGAGTVGTAAVPGTTTSGSGGSGLVIVRYAV